MKRKVMKMKDMKGRKGLVEEIVPFGSSEYDYDDDALEIYGDEFGEELDKEISEMLNNSKK